MTAPFRSQLILDHGTGKSRLRIALNRPFDIERIAVAGIGVADHRHRHRVADIAPLFQHFGIGDQPGIRQTQLGPRNRETAHKTGVKARPLDDPRRQGVKTGRGYDDARLRQSCPKPLRGGYHRKISAGADRR